MTSTTLISKVNGRLARACLVGAFSSMLLVGCGGHSGRTPQTASTPPTSSPAASAQQVLTRALAAAAAKRWVHMDVKTSAAGHLITFNDDDGPNAGIQRISIRGAGSGVVRVVGSDTYMKADETALQGYFGLPASGARRAANLWLHLVPGDSGYATVTQGVTIDSALHEVTVLAPLQLLPAQQRDGRTVVGVTGGAGKDAPAGATATLWIDPGTGLPVEYDANAAGGDSITSLMSRWGQSIAVQRPPTSTSIRQFGG